MKTFGERLKFLIKQSDLKTIKKFSERAHLHEVSVSNIVRGKNNPSFDVIMACLDIFTDIQVMWLLTGKDYSSELELENKQLKEKVTFFQSKLGNVAKPSSSRMNPQLSFPGFGFELALK